MRTGLRIIGGMNTTSTSPPLARFHTELNQSVLGLRRAALFALLDAMLSGERAGSLVRHSLAPVFRRGWSSACDALADGSLDLPALRRLFATTMPPAVVAAGAAAGGLGRQVVPSAPVSAGRAGAGGTTLSKLKILSASPKESRLP